MATVGKNILENLTTGMYHDSKVCYREYIQNACDQIDIAIKQGLLRKEEAVVDIWIDVQGRTISVEDNATGVRADEFVESLGDVANSSKIQGENKGFRGIGRLIGLAYCKTLKFTTSFKGESVASVMICDAQKMRRMIGEKQRYTLEEVWESIVKYEQFSEEADAHYFKVEMLEINPENTELLNVDKVKEYLSFVAPVPYKNTFIFRNKVYDFARENGFVIDEYNVSVNGESIFKNYTTTLKEQLGQSTKRYDEIQDVQFEILKNQNDEVVAWVWYGISRFTKVIPVCNQMRGLRLRSGNIQIGTNDTLTALFKEQRGNSYFIGEVFAVDRRLIPNSQRDYFNENQARVDFEVLATRFFYDTLHQMYHRASDMNNAYKRQEEYVEKHNEFVEKSKSNGFINEEDRKKLQSEVEEAQKKAEEAKKKIERMKEKDADSPVTSVYRTIEKHFDAKKPTLVTEEQADTEEKKGKDGYISSEFPQLNRKERKLVSTIMSIIAQNAPKEIAAKIIEEIRKELK